MTPAIRYVLQRAGWLCRVMLNGPEVMTPRRRRRLEQIRDLLAEEIDEW